MWIDSAGVLRTGPSCLQVPLVKEDELPLAVVDGGLSLHLADLRHLTTAVLVLHLQPEHERL